MAVPKKKVSKSRRDSRRSHDRLKRARAMECPNCG
ncbi:MAG: 50S ribosomal protein L32, partial [Proteobacteria bacterium]|nr:50S ribosomal protein L32 [Pseudomonadota bacterium]